MCLYDRIQKIIIDEEIFVEIHLAVADNAIKGNVVYEGYPYKFDYSRFVWFKINDSDDEIRNKLLYLIEIVD